VLALEDPFVQRSVLISIIRPLGYIHSSAFAEVAETLMFGFKRLGIEASIVENKISKDQMTILLGWNLLSPEILQSLPETAIIYNLEQFHDGSPWFNERVLNVLSNRVVWDYSLTNIRYLRLRGVFLTKHVPIGYVPELTRIQNLESPEIDVLFYGSINERRQSIIAKLQARGLNVKVLFGIYGRDRDVFIANSKMVLNVHYYPTNIFEIVRLSYLMANRKPIVSEESVDATSTEWGRAVRFASYEKLVDSCLVLLNDRNLRQTVGDTGLEIFSRHDEATILREALS